MFFHFFSVCKTLTFIYSVHIKLLLSNYFSWNLSLWKISSSYIFVETSNDFFADAQDKSLKLKVDGGTVLMCIRWHLIYAGIILFFFCQANANKRAKNRWAKKNIFHSPNLFNFNKNILIWHVTNNPSPKCVKTFYVIIIKSTKNFSLTWVFCRIDKFLLSEWESLWLFHCFVKEFCWKNNKVTQGVEQFTLIKRRKLFNGVWNFFEQLFPAFPFLSKCCLLNQYKRII